MAIVFNIMFVVAVAGVINAFPSPAQFSGDSSGVETNTHDPTEFLNFEAENFPLTGVVLDDLNRDRRSNGGRGIAYGRGNSVSYGRSAGGYGNYGGAGYGGGYSGGRILFSQNKYQEY